MSAKPHAVQTYRGRITHSTTDGLATFNTIKRLKKFPTQYIEVSEKNRADSSRLVNAFVNTKTFSSSAIEAKLITKPFNVLYSIINADKQIGLLLFKCQRNNNLSWLRVLKYHYSEDC